MAVLRATVPTAAELLRASRVQLERAGVDRAEAAVLFRAIEMVRECAVPAH